MLAETYYKIASFVTETFGSDFIVISLVITTTASLAYFVIISYMITKLDKHYFVREKTSPMLEENIRSKSKRKMISGPINTIKIIFGAFLILCGIAMLVLPGQGLITILIGLSLIPFPGKDQIEKNLLAKKSVRATLNWIRVKANKEPFVFDS